MKQAIGGYFELELNKKPIFHKDAIALNSGRNAFEYILLANKYKKVFIPHYTCYVLLQPIVRNSIHYEFYAINERLEPIFDFEKLTPNDAFLYTNYFGLKDEFIHNIISHSSNVVIDNAQSFFSMPQNGADTFYSPRKFFGLPDGGFVYCKKKLDIDLDVDNTSIDRIGHLMKRLASDAEEGYDDFKRNEDVLNNLQILQMSRLTKKLLSNIDYEGVKKRRLENFDFLHKKLGKSNKFATLIDDSNIIAPLGYPYLVNNGNELRAKLQTKRIFTPIYWSNVLATSDKDSIELDLVNNMVHLPIDQRYNSTDLEYISNQINEI